MRKPQRVKSKTKIAMLKPQLVKNERRLSQQKSRFQTRPSRQQTISKAESGTNSLVTQLIED